MCVCMAGQYLAAINYSINVSYSCLFCFIDSSIHSRTLCSTLDNILGNETDVGPALIEVAA